MNVNKLNTSKSAEVVPSELIDAFSYIELVDSTTLQVKEWPSDNIFTNCYMRNINIDGNNTLYLSQQRLEDISNTGNSTNLVWVNIPDLSVINNQPYARYLKFSSEISPAQYDSNINWLCYSTSVW